MQEQLVTNSKDGDKPMAMCTTSEDMPAEKEQENDISVEIPINGGETFTIGMIERGKFFFVTCFKWLQNICKLDNCFL